MDRETAILKRMFGRVIGSFDPLKALRFVNCPKCKPPKMSSYLEGRLMSESESGGEECVRVLIQAGADVNKRDSYNRTPLMLAAKYGFHKCVKLLLKAGADVNMEDMVDLLH